MKVRIMLALSQAAVLVLHVAGEMAGFWLGSGKLLLHDDSPVVMQTSVSIINSSH